MKIKISIIILIIITNLCVYGAVPKKINLESLLVEMVDKTTLTRYPTPYYETKQFSSYDRKSVKIGNPSWFANADRSQFIRTEKNKGKREFVLFDAEGPGSVVRFWLTVAGYSDKGVLRFYFDGNETPEIEGEVLSIVGGNKLVGEPLSESVSKLTEQKQRGHNLYLPIPYKKHLKITYESPSIIEPGENPGENFYYNINYRTYEKGTNVISFNKKDLIDFVDEINQAQRILLLNTQEKINKRYSKSISKNINLSNNNNNITISGTKAIREISLKIKTDDLNQALRSTIISISFDDNQTVWAPIGDFFGTGNRFYPFNTFYTSLSNDTTFTCSWIMPFKEKCNIIIENLNKATVLSNLSVSTSSWKWNNQTMYFCAGWTEYNRIQTKINKEPYDVNFVSISGKGLFVGDVLTLFNSANAWWGEGDEKIYIDNEKFPSHFGTGSEDYYGYAWCMGKPFDHPFIAQPDGSGAMKPGHVSNLRFRGLDAIPFKKSFVFDMEVLHWINTYINYAPTSFWYMLPGTQSNRKSEPEKASLKIVRNQKEMFNNKPDINGVVEGEFMEITVTKGDILTQSITELNWSFESQSFWRYARKGDIGTYVFESDNEGIYNIVGNFTLAQDYGTFKYLLNDVELHPSIDLYSKNLTTKLIDFGQASILKGKNKLIVIQLEKNINSSDNFFGLDFIKISK